MRYALAKFLIFYAFVWFPKLAYRKVKGTSNPRNLSNYTYETRLSRWAWRIAFKHANTFPNKVSARDYR